MRERRRNASRSARLLPAQHVAAGEVHQIPVARAVVFERRAQALGVDAPKKRAHAARPAVEREVIDRRVEELFVAPHQTVGPLRVVGEPGFGLDEAVRHGERRLASGAIASKKP